MTFSFKKNPLPPIAETLCFITEVQEKKLKPSLLLGMYPILILDLCLFSLLSHKGHSRQKLSHPVTVTSTPASFTKKWVKYLSINVMTYDIIRIIRK